MSGARKQLHFSGDVTPQKYSGVEEELLPITPARTRSTLDETQDDEHNMSPTVTTVKRPRIVGTSLPVVASQSQVASQLPPSDPSPVPKKPRVDQILKSVLAGGAVRATAPPPISSSQGELLPDVTPQTAVRTTQASQLSPPLSQSLAEAFSAEMAPFATPVATQLFEPDEPLTATQEAYVVDGFEMPSPPPFFGPTAGSQERGADGSTPAGASARRRAAEIDTKSTQECLVQWAESTKAFFNFIDRRRIIDVDE